VPRAILGPTSAPISLEVSLSCSILPPCASCSLNGARNRQNSKRQRASPFPAMVPLCLALSGRPVLPLPPSCDLGHPFLIWRPKIMDTPSAAILLKGPCVFLDLNPQSKTYSINTLSLSENVDSF
jgi:hypothetical protein